MTIKKVSSLILLILGFLTMPVSAQEIPRKLGIPKRFDNYQTKGYLLSPRNIYLEGDQFYIQRYSLDKEKRADVQEFYQILGTNENGNLRLTPNPFLYSFDLNNNGKVDEEEILVDGEKDGLSGNEEWAWMIMRGIAEKDTLRI